MQTILKGTTHNPKVNHLAFLPSQVVETKGYHILITKTKLINFHESQHPTNRNHAHIPRNSRQVGKQKTKLCASLRRHQARNVPRDEERTRALRIRNLLKVRKDYRQRKRLVNHCK
ncbi:hypothetical protein DPMN_161317 [Dreissena polymorpha]|uniref:Uncharacterized protein n=1 Tax=Dreissena polymorpha TaxID=45954 RepID=A0A9D4IQZ9_DREPO|nr:hypothetical protein DPMN_161317 [Dreissena polymorpha]